MEQARIHDQKLDNLRAFAIIVVVLGHSIILYSGSWNLYHSSRSSAVFHYMKEIINLFQMPLFFSLSGFLFAKTTKLNSFIQFVVKKIKRLIVPFLFIGLVYMIPLKLALHYPGYQGKGYFGALKLFLNGSDLGHLWFLPTLFFFFLISYCVMKLLGNRNAVWLIVTAVMAVASLYHWRGGAYIVYIQYFFKYYWSFSIGALLSGLDLQKVSAKQKLTLGCFTVLIAVVCIFLRNNLLSTATSIVILLSCYLLTPEKSIKLINNISRNSFGIYLIHSPLIYITCTFMLNALPIAVFAVNYFVFGFVAYYASEYLSKTPVKYLIGQWK